MNIQNRVITAFGKFQNYLGTVKIVYGTCRRLESLLNGLIWSRNDLGQKYQFLIRQEMLNYLEMVRNDYEQLDIFRKHQKYLRTVRIAHGCPKPRKKSQ